MLADAGHINKSLYTLGKVIRGLERLARDPSTAPRVPYRDSALTKLLDQFPGGLVKNINGRLLRVVGQGHPRDAEDRGLCGARAGHQELT